MIFGAPPIVTNGLLLNLDAGNSKSYPGSGTTWSDLSGNNNTGTLTNNTFSILGGGSVSFNGSTSVVGLGDNDLFSFTSGGGTDLPFSISGWFRLNAYGSGASAYSIFICKSQYSGTWTREWQLAHNNSNGISLGIFNPDISGTNYLVTAVGTPLQLTTWYFITATYSGSKTNAGMKIYINGIVQTTSNANSGTYTGMGNTVTTVELGRQTATGGIDNGYFNGNMSNVLIYRNKELTTSEIRQNYNALKSRFNLS